MAKANPIKHFEQNLQELETLVEALESGDLSLEESLNHFEKGVKKTQACQEALAAAEQKVKILTEASDGLTLEDFKQDHSHAE